MDSHSLALISTLLLVFSAAIIGGVVAKLLKQPMVLGYIAAGILFGNLFPNITDSGFLSAIAQSGITLLLFTLGVEFSFHRMKKLLRLIGWAAGFQIVLVMFLMLLLSLTLGIPFVTSLFISVAASLSSTAIIMKILAERGEVDTTPGELIMAWLVVQDLSVIPIMIMLPAVVSAARSPEVAVIPIVGAIALSLLKAAAILFVVVYLGRKGIPALLNAIAGIGSREILVLSTVGLVFFFGLLTFVFGLSAALGAFIAGLLISETSQNHAIFAEVRPLRDLFAVIFFVSLGMGLPASTFVNSGWILLGLAAAVIFVKWFVVMGLMRFLGHHRKSSFLVAVGLIPMSEFGFIIASQGLSLHAITQSDYSLIVALTFITILVSAPLTSQGHGLYYWLHHALGKRWPTLFHTKEELATLKEELPYRDHIVICGYGRVGKYVGRALEMAGIPFVVVDYNNATVRELKEKGIPVVYGDPADKDVLDFAQVGFAKAVIIAIPDRHTQELVIGNAQTLNRHIKIICRTHHEEDQKDLKSLGVDAVVQPEFEAAISIVERLLPSFGVNAEDMAGKISRLKIEHGAG